MRRHVVTQRKFVQLVLFIVTLSATGCTFLRERKSSPHLRTPASVGKEKILYIGDSHSVGLIGVTIDENLRSLENVEVNLYASCGSTSTSWLNGNGGGCGYRQRGANGLSVLRTAPLPQKTAISNKKQKVKDPIPTLGQLLFTLKPTITIINLGGNNVKSTRSLTNEKEKDLNFICLPTREATASSFRKVIQQVKSANSRCLWVGPPHSRGFVQRCYAEVYELLEKVTAEEKCDFIDTRPLAYYPDRVDPLRFNMATDGDGLHYDTLPDGKNIAIEVGNRIFMDIKPYIRPEVQLEKENH